MDRYFLCVMKLLNCLIASRHGLPRTLGAMRLDVLSYAVIVTGFLKVCYAAIIAVLEHCVSNQDQHQLAKAPTLNDLHPAPNPPDGLLSVHQMSIFVDQLFAMSRFADLVDICASIPQSCSSKVAPHLSCQLEIPKNASQFISAELSYGQIEAAQTPSVSYQQTSSNCSDAPNSMIQ